MTSTFDLGTDAFLTSMKLIAEILLEEGETTEVPLHACLATKQGLLKVTFEFEVWTEETKGKYAEIVSVDDLT